MGDLRRGLGVSYSRVGFSSGNPGEQSAATVAANRGAQLPFGTARAADGPHPSKSTPTTSASRHAALYAASRRGRGSVPTGAHRVADHDREEPD
jgi:hypothetical protein